MDAAGSCKTWFYLFNFRLFRSLIGQLHGGSTSGGVGHDMSSSSRVASAAPTMGAGHSRWRLRADRVPSHISYAIAEKIFFIGESIQLFESDTEGSPVTNSSSTKKDVLKEEEVALYNQVWSPLTLACSLFFSDFFLKNTFQKDKSITIAP